MVAVLVPHRADTIGAMLRVEPDATGTRVRGALAPETAVALSAVRRDRGEGAAEGPG